jgi:hypothetical protein
MLQRFVIHPQYAKTQELTALQRSREYFVVQVFRPCIDIEGTKLLYTLLYAVFSTHLYISLSFRQDGLFDVRYEWDGHGYEF